MEYLQQVIEGKIKGCIEVTGRWGRRHWKLMDDLKERKGYTHLKKEALDRTILRARFGRGFGPVSRQTTKWMNINCYQICWHINRTHQRTMSSTKLAKNWGWKIGPLKTGNWAIKNWNQLPAEALRTFPCKPKIFRNRVRKAIINGVKWKE